MQKAIFYPQTNHLFASRQTVIHSRVKIVLKLYFMHIWLVVRLFNIYIIKAGMCVCLSNVSNVRTLTSPPVLMLWGTQGYLWLPYDLTEVINIIGETFELKKYFFFKKILYVIPSALVSFLP